MKTALVQAALGVSVLFNLGFGAGYFKARNSSETASAPDAAEQFAAQLQLTSEQRDLFDRLREQARNEQAPLRDAMTLVQTDLMDAYTQAPDRTDHLSGLYEELSDLRLAYWESSTEPMLKFYAHLSEEQRNRMSERMAGSDRFEHFRKMVQQFDADGDGRLDDSERRQMYQGLRSRFQDQLPQRPAPEARPGSNPDAAPQNALPSSMQFRQHRLQMLQRLQRHRGGPDARPPFSRERFNESRDAAPR